MQSSPKNNIYHKGWIDFNKNGKMDIYEDPSASIDDRVTNLLSQMTMDEKTWEIQKSTIDKPSTKISDNVKISIEESGSCFVALRIERTYKTSKFVQYIRMVRHSSPSLCVALSYGTNIPYVCRFSFLSLIL